MTYNKFCLDLSKVYFVTIIDTVNLTSIKMYLTQNIPDITLDFKKEQSESIDELYTLLLNHVGEDYILISNNDKIYVERKYKKD